MKRKLLILFIVIIPTLAAAQWNIVDSLNTNAYAGIHFWNPNEGIACLRGNGIFIKTTDGGHTWDTTQVLFSDTVFGLLEDMQFVTPNTGFAAGGSGFSIIQNALIRTDDRGATWDTLQLNVPELYGIEGIDFVLTGSVIQGIIHSFSGLFKTLDGGKTISEVPLPPQLPFSFVGGAVMAAPYIVLLASDNVIYRTADWGQNWQQVYTDTSSYIGSMTFRNGTGYAICGNRLLKTTNAGTTWTKLNIPGADSITFDKVKMEDDGNLYLAGNHGLFGYIFGSADGGITWDSAYVDYDYMIFRDISMPTPQIGYIASTRRLHKTVTGGGLNLSVANHRKTTGNIVIYPNPANRNIRVKATGYCIESISIYDMTGKLMIKAPGANTIIDISVLCAGNYIAATTTDKGTVLQKLIVKP